jgi:hypothetical protein
MTVEWLRLLFSDLPPWPEMSLSEVFAPAVDRLACRYRESSGPARTDYKGLRDHTLSSAGGTACRPVGDAVVCVGGAQWHWSWGWRCWCWCCRPDPSLRKFVVKLDAMKEESQSCLPLGHSADPHGSCKSESEAVKLEAERLCCVAILVCLTELFLYGRTLQFHRDSSSSPNAQILF